VKASKLRPVVQAPAQQNSIIRPRSNRNESSLAVVVASPTLELVSRGLEPCAIVHTCCYKPYLSVSLGVLGSSTCQEPRAMGAMTKQCQFSLDVLLAAFAPSRLGAVLPPVNVYPFIQLKAPTELLDCVRWPPSSLARRTSENAQPGRSHSEAPI